MGFLGESEKKKKSSPKKLIRNLRHFTALLKGKELPEDVMRKVWRYASKGPESSLDHFYLNLNVHVKRAVDEIRKEKGLVQEEKFVEEEVLEKEVLEEKVPVKEKKKVERKSVKRPSIIDFEEVEPIVLAKPQEKQEVTVTPKEIPPIVTEEGVQIPRKSDGDIDVAQFIAMRKFAIEDRVRELKEKE